MPNPVASTTLFSMSAVMNQTAQFVRETLIESVASHSLHEAIARACEATVATYEVLPPLVIVWRNGVPRQHVSVHPLACELAPFHVLMGMAVLTVPLAGAERVDIIGPVGGEFFGVQTPVPPLGCDINGILCVSNVGTQQLLWRSHWAGGHFYVDELELSVGGLLALQEN